MTTTAPRKLNTDRRDETLFALIGDEFERQRDGLFFFYYY